jgi:hypothetical protein
MIPWILTLNTSNALSLIDPDGSVTATATLDTAALMALFAHLQAGDQISYNIAASAACHD